VEYPKDDLSEIAAAAPRLVPTEQIALARDSWALIRAGRLDIGPFLAIGESLRNTDVPEVLRSVTDHLGFVESELASDANRDAFRAWMRSRYAPRLRELGWEPKAAEPNSTKEVRAALIGLLATARDPDVLAEARRLANRVLDDYASVDPSIRAVVVTRAATSGDAAFYERYAARLGSARTPAEYYLFLGSLAWFEDPALQNRTLAFALTPDVRPQDMGQLLASMLVNPETRRNAWTFVTTNWDRIVARLPEGLTVAGALLADVSGSFCTAAQRQGVADFFERHPLTGNDRPLRRALESIDSCIGLREREQAPLATWLASQHTQ
jgi:aminopeptidase N